MQIKYRLNKDLPPLAWLSNCLDGEVDVLHGNKVECRENFFVDGAWNGEFEKGGFAEADWFCGTGGRVSERKVIFSTPTHVIGGLYLAKIAGGGVLYI